MHSGERLDGGPFRHAPRVQHRGWHLHLCLDSVRPGAKRADAGGGTHPAGRGRGDDDAGGPAGDHPHLSQSGTVAGDELRHHPGADGADARAHGRRPDRALALVALHLLHQRAGGADGAVAGASLHAGLPRRVTTPAGYRRSGAVRQRRGFAFLAAGNLRRASDRRDLGRAAAGAEPQPAGRVFPACPPDAPSAAAPDAVPGAHVSRRGGGRLHHASGNGWHAVSAAAALSARPGHAGLAVGPADDANRSGGHVHEVHLVAGAGTLWLPAHPDREHGDDRGSSSACSRW